MPDPAADITASLEAHSRGDERAGRRLMPVVYDELRRLAAGFLRGERPGHSLAPTDLVHEAYLRLVDLDRIDWQGKTHFRAMAGRQMRRILVEHARRAGARKRGARPCRVTLDEDVALVHADSVDVLALEQALDKLAAADPRPCQVAVLRFYAGMGVDEVAHVLGVSAGTVKNDWRFARAWLSRELAPST